MQVIILLAVIAISHAQVLITPVFNTGASSQHRSQDGHGNYNFGYNEDHATGSTFRKETGTQGSVAGSYGLKDIDGRQRIVNYVADADGFRADIKSNEPGVESKDPASTAINKIAIVAPTVYYQASPDSHYASVSTLHHVAAPNVPYATVASAVRVAGPYGVYDW